MEGLTPTPRPSSLRGLSGTLPALHPPQLHTKMLNQVQTGSALTLGATVHVSMWKRKCS